MLPLQQFPAKIQISCGVETTVHLILIIPRLINILAVSVQVTKVVLMKRLVAKQRMKYAVVIPMYFQDSWINLGDAKEDWVFFGKPSKDCEKSLRASQLFSNESGLEQRPPSSEGQRPTEKRGQNSSQQTRKSSAPIFVAKLSQIEEEESGSASSSESKKGLSILNSNSNFMWDRSSTSTTSKQEQVNDT